MQGYSNYQFGAAIIARPRIVREIACLSMQTQTSIFTQGARAVQNRYQSGRRSRPVPDGSVSNSTGWRLNSSSVLDGAGKELTILKGQERLQCESWSSQMSINSSLFPVSVEDSFSSSATASQAFSVISKPFALFTKPTATTFI